MRACLAALGLLACGTDPGPGTEGAEDPCAPPGSPTLEIGLGLSGYEPLDEGDPIPLVHGPQGGYHLEIGLEATNLAADDLVKGHVTGEIDGVVLAESRPWLDLRCRLPDLPVQQSYGTLLVYDAQPEELDGRTTVIRVEVTDLEGNVVTAETSFVIDDTAEPPTER